MQNGPYIRDRILPATISALCTRTATDFRAFSDNWVLRLEKNRQVRWVVGYKFDVNDSAAGQLAQDKVATYMVLAAAGVPAIEHYLVRSVPHEPMQWHINLPNLEGVAVVVKPLDGTGGRAVERYESITMALDAVHSSGEPAWAISPHYDLQAEYRMVMLDGQVLLAFSKTNPTMRGRLRLFNLGYGAAAADISDTDLLGRLTSIAVKTTQALALRLAAVDIVCTAAGELRVLEVNDGISLEHYAEQSAEYKQRAVDVYEKIVAAMFAEKPYTK